MIRSARAAQSGFTLNLRLVTANLVNSAKPLPLDRPLNTMTNPGQALQISGLDADFLQQPITIFLCLKVLGLIDIQHTTRPCHILNKIDITSSRNDGSTQTAECLHLGARLKHASDARPGFLQTKKNPEIHTFVGLPGFEDGGSCGIRTYDQLVKSQLLYQLS